MGFAINLSRIIGKKMHFTVNSKRKLEKPGSMAARAHDEN